MFILRQSTAVDVLIGPFVDGTDGVTTEEALSPSVQVSKNGQTAATKSDVTTPTHDNAGYYNCVFNTTDTGTVGTLVAFVEGTTATHLAVRHEFQIMDTAAFDALFADGAEGPLQGTTVGNKLDVSATGEAGLDWANIGSPTTAQNLSGTNIDVDQVVASVSGNVDGSVATLTTLPTIPANWLTAAGTHADFGTEIGTACWATVTRTLTTADWNVGKTGYSLTTADWNVGKTGYALTVTPPTAVQIRTELDSNSTTLATLIAGIIEGTTSGTPSTTSTDTDLSGYVTGELVDRVIVFTGGTADGQAATILTYTSTNGVVTFAALTTAPAASDTFKIV